MPEAATPARTTRPARKRAPAKTAAAKPAPAATTKPAEAVEAEAEKERIVIELESVGDTKRFSKFVVPEANAGAVAGSIYAPLGATRVRVLIEGPAS